MANEVKGHCCYGCNEYKRKQCYRAGFYHDCGYLANSKSSKKIGFLRKALNKTLNKELK